MNRGRTWRHTLTIAAAACLAATVAAPASSQAAGSTGGAAADRPDLSLRVASKAVTAHKSGDHKVFLDLGAYLVAGDVPFQVNSTRASYRKPVVGTVIGDPDDPADDITLTQDMVSGFNGLRDFVHLRIRDTDGRIVGEQTKGFCAAAGAVRVRPNAPDTSDFPNSDFYGGCRYHPFTLGSVLGVQEGWGASVLGYGSRMELARGRYDVTVTIDKDYRDLLGISAEDGQAALRLKVVKGEDHCEGASGCAEQPRSTGRRPAAAGARSAHDTALPADGNFADLRSLPSTGIRVRNGYLTFGATVWNAGPSPLVVDGFRKRHEDVMTSWQYFYDEDGNPTGHQEVGSMEWDARSGHHHWHFRDFARYRLLDADQENIVRSKKEAFCLAATDAVDYTVPGADWNPYYTDLETQCGGFSSLGVREVLAAGSGDTYSQYRPGQSFRLAGLPDGIYFIETKANPAGNLVETDYDNNTSLRKIRIGTDGDNQRTVKVFDVGLVQTH